MTHRRVNRTPCRQGCDHRCVLLCRFAGLLALALLCAFLSSIWFSFSLDCGDVLSVCMCSGNCDVSWRFTGYTSCLPITLDVGESKCQGVEWLTSEVVRAPHAVAVKWPLWTAAIGVAGGGAAALGWARRKGPKRGDESRRLSCSGVPEEVRADPSAAAVRRRSRRRLTGLAVLGVVSFGVWLSSAWLYFWLDCGERFSVDAVWGTCDVSLRLAGHRPFWPIVADVSDAGWRGLSWGTFGVSVSPNTIEAEFSLWPIPASFALLGVILLVARWRLRRRSPGAEPCRRCGYDVRGNESGCCPECGTRVEQKGP